MAVTPPPSITPPPTRPDRADPTTFSNRADAWTIWERDKQVPEMGAIGANVYGNAVDAAASATTASNASTSAAGSATSAGNSATSASGSATSAGNSATAASNSATAADGSKTAASNSAGAAAASASQASGFATQAMGYRDDAANIRDQTEAIRVGDIRGTAPDKFSDNSMLRAAIQGTGPLDYSNNAMLPPVVRSTALTGLLTNSSVPITESDSVIGAFGKLQAQVSASGNSSSTVNKVSTITTGTTAVAGTLYVIAANLILTLPASPAVGTRVGFLNMSGVTTSQISPNGQKIRGLAESMTLNVPNAQAELVYTGTTYGWV